MDRSLKFKVDLDGDGEPDIKGDIPLPWLKRIFVAITGFVILHCGKVFR